MPYTPFLRPRAHQLEARRRMLAIPAAPCPTDAFALLMEMGTGKSKVIVDEFGERAYHDDVDSLLLIAPAGCYANWSDDRGPDEPSELRKSLDPDVMGKTTIARWVSGGGRRSREAIERAVRWTRGSRVLVMNCEALSSVRDARLACVEFLETSRRGAIVVVDESTTIKGEDSIRTEVIGDLGQMPSVAARRILTGLVAPHSPLDLYAQFGFLDWRILGHQSYWTFKRRYAVMRRMTVGGWDPERRERTKGRTVWQTVAYQNVEELTELTAPYSYRKLKSECLDLPPKQYLPLRDVELTDEQRRIYNEIRLFATARVGAATEEGASSYVVATMVLAQRLRMNQVLCGFVVDEEGREHEVPENRTSELLEVLGETEGKVIVWTSHDRCVRALALRLRQEFGPRSVAQFWGGNRSTRGEDETRFKRDPACRFMVATPAAGGRGNTWTVAGLQVFYDNSDNLEHRMQAEDRNHRDGLTGPGGAGRADYVDLCARNTLDYKKIKSLRAKLDIATQINGDNYREWLI